jgi:hypothetical protein
MVCIILDNIAAGLDRAEILASYPSLKPPDIDAALAYAAELARDLPLSARMGAKGCTPPFIPAADRRSGRIPALPYPPFR